MKFGKSETNYLGRGLTVSHTTNIDSSKQNELEDDNFKLDENGRKFYIRLEKTWNRSNCSLQVIFPLPTLISKDLYCIHITKERNVFFKILW